MLDQTECSLVVSSTVQPWLKGCVKGGRNSEEVMAKPSRGNWREALPPIPKGNLKYLNAIISAIIYTLNISAVSENNFCEIKAPRLCQKDGYKVH